MTIAICPECGDYKQGALVPCTGCGFEPSTPEQMACAIYLTDHHQSAEQLKAASGQIRAGERVAPPPEVLDRMAGAIAQAGDVTAEVRRYMWGCLGLATLVMVGAVWLFYLVFSP